ncbi:MAG: response regulator transcription factor [Streptosporangiaceae bacterium]
MIRLAIVDGHTLARLGLRQIAACQPDLEIVAECESASQARDTLGESDPAVVTVDNMLPDGDGLALAREMHEQSPRLGIVMLATTNQDELLFRALDAGVSAFVPKTAPVAEVVAAIRHAAAAPASFTSPGLAVALARRRAIREQSRLSPREHEVLRLLRDGKSIPAIALTMYISPSTAKTYVARLYDKLGASNRAQALMSALRCGLISYEDQHETERLPLAVTPATLCLDSVSVRDIRRASASDRASSQCAMRVLTTILNRAGSVGIRRIQEVSNAPRCRGHAR